MEVYVNDMLVKSNEFSRYIAKLEKAFNTFRKHQMKLNPSVPLKLLPENFFSLWFLNRE